MDMKEITLTHTALERTKEMLSQPEKFSRNNPDACEFSRLVAAKIKDAQEMSTIQFLKIIMDILKRLAEKEELQSSPLVENPLWKMKGDELVLTALPHFSNIYERALPPAFAKELTEAIIEKIKPGNRKSIAFAIN